MIIPGIPSRLLMLAIISLMVILQTFIFIMSCFKETSSSDETASFEAASLPGVNFPFLKDPETVKYIATQMQVMFVLHGTLLGKGTLAQAIVDTYKDSVRCCFSSSDSSNPSGIAGQTCQDQITDSCKKGIRVIIVNSTASDPSHLQDYFSLAHQYNYTTLVVEPNATSSYDCKHKLQAECQQDSANNDDKKLPGQGITYPLFYGWFLGYNISLKTQGTGKQVFGECTRQPKFLEIFKKYAVPGAPRNTSGDLDLDHYFSLEGLITGTTLLHCTSFFSNYNKSGGSTQYATSPAVRQAMGRAYNLTIIGFSLTPRTLGARILLDKDELPLWSTNKSFVSEVSSEDKVRHEENQLDLSYSEKTNPEKSTIDPMGHTEVKCPKGWHPTKFSPTCGLGSQAHLTLGVGKDIGAVQTGSDVNAIIRKELEAVAKKEDILTLPLDSGTVRHYGDGNWAVYLDKPFQIGTLFAAWY